MCKSKRLQNKSYETLAQYYKDEFVPIRLQFFKDIASLLKEYLETYQTDSPMVPFLGDVLESNLRTLMKMFVKRELLDAENRMSSELTNLPTATKNLLKSGVLHEDKKRRFRKVCMSMLVAIVQNLQERSPLKYLLVRCASCLSPIQMVRKKEECNTRFTSLVDKLYVGKWISAKDADNAKREYDIFLDAVQHEHKDEFLTFDIKTKQVDRFLASFIHGNSKYKNCWNVCKLILTLSHGQSAVERGFSINKELLVENLEKVPLVSQRMVYDHVMSTENPLTEYYISNDLLKSCRLAHSRYTAALEVNKNALIKGRKQTEKESVNWRKSLK